MHICPAGSTTPRPDFSGSAPEGAILPRFTTPFLFIRFRVNQGYARAAAIAVRISRKAKDFELPPPERASGIGGTQMLLQPWHQFDQVARPVACIKLRGQDVVPRILDRAGA